MYEGIKKALFTGDCLFIGGCGRFFEGDAKDMVKCMDTFRQLDDDVQVFCGHEYTVANYEFAVHISKEMEYSKALSDAEAKLEKEGATIPSTIL